MNRQIRKSRRLLVRSIKLLSLLCLGLLSEFALAISSATMLEQGVFVCGSASDNKSQYKDKIFESVPTKPIALSNDGSLLFVINSPSNCLEIYKTGGQKLELVSAIRVGVDPVSVAVRSASEVWVVNHISDSISVINIAGKPRIERTLQVGDAPWDIVFGNSAGKHKGRQGNRKDRAFITSSYRGQQHPQFKAEYMLQNRLDTTDGSKGELIGRADVWVFDINDQRVPVLAGIINTFTSSLRALSVDRSGERVFATAFKSGNRTAVTPIPFDKLAGESWSAEGVGHLEPFAIVQQHEKKWLDVKGQEFPTFMNYDIADNDVFVIKASAPLQLGNANSPKFNRHAISQTVEMVGGVLFNTEFDDHNNRLLISAVDAHNTTPNEHNLNGVFVSNLLKVVDFNQMPAKTFEVNLDVLIGSSGSPEGFALPTGMLLGKRDKAGQRDIHITSMGTNQILSFNLDIALNGGNAKKSKLQKFPSHIGPTAMIAGAQAQEFYYYSYVKNTVSTMKLADKGLLESSTITMFNPELDILQDGRQFLYDAVVTSHNQRVSCASCHIFGGDDKLQWILSKKDAKVLVNILPFIETENRKTSPRAIKLKRDGNIAKVGDQIPFGDIHVEVKYVGDQKGFADGIESGDIDFAKSGFAYLTDVAEPDKRLSRFKILTGKATWVLMETPFLHPLKGPMRTTPLHGIADSGPMHFLGDKFGLVVNAEGPCSDASITQEARAYKEFNSPCDGSPGPFETLLGGDHLPEKFMDQLTAFSLALVYPPNPIRPLNNQVNQLGEKVFGMVEEGDSLEKGFKIGPDLTNWDDIMDKKPLVFGCVDCHTIIREAKLFGTSKLIYSAPPLSLQDAKVPHLRFLYDRAGFLRGDYRETTSFLNMKMNNDYYDEVVHAQGLNHGGWFDFSMFFADMVWIVGAGDPNNPHAPKEPYDPGSPASKEKYFNLFQFLMEFDTNYFPMYGRQITVADGDLKDPIISAQVANYIDNAKHPKSAKNLSQCNIYVSGAESDRSEKNLINNINDLVNISENVAGPQTLTCL